MFVESLGTKICQVL